MIPIATRVPFTHFYSHRFSEPVWPYLQTLQAVSYPNSCDEVCAQKGEPDGTLTNETSNSGSARGAQEDGS